MTDFSLVAGAALRACPGLLQAWIPGGKLHGSEYDVLNPTRADSCIGNFRVNIVTGKWSDFATGDKGGDLVALRAYLDGSSQSDAAQAIEKQLGLNGYSGFGPDPIIAPFLAAMAAKINGATSQCVMPVPIDAPPAPLPQGAPIWTYTDIRGRLLGYVVRFDPPGKKKEFRPLTYWQSDSEAGWQWKSFPKPAPLYGLEGLADRLDAPVMVAEGEKASDAAGRYFPDFVPVTWPGGSSRAKDADWSHCAGRSVWLMPDHDEAGMKAMQDVAACLMGIAAEIHLFILPDDLPPKWDVADGNWADRTQAELWLSGLSGTEIKGKAAPQRKEVEDEDDRFAAELKRANGKGPQYVVSQMAAWTPTPLPVPILARLEAEILRRVPMRSALAAQITTKAIMAFVTGRQVISQAGDPTGLYLAMAAPSVGDLRPYLAVARDVIEQAGMSKAVRQQRLSNTGQIHKLLWRQPNLLHLCSEWGIILQFAKRQPAGAIEQVLTLLSEVWSGKPITMDVDDIKMADPGVDGQYVIRSPHITLLAALSHDQLATAMKLSEMGRGALEQIQYWILEDDEFTEADPGDLLDAPFPADLIADLKYLATPATGTGNLAGLALPDQAPQQVTATFSESIQSFYAPLDALPTHRSARSILSASRQIVRREATNLAFFKDRQRPVLTADLIKTSVASEVARLGRLLARFSSLSSEDGVLSAYQKVLDFITAEKGSGASKRVLCQQCWPYRNLSDDKRDALISQLLNDEAIMEIQPESKFGARRKSLVYVAKQFVKAVAS